MDVQVIYALAAISTIVDHSTVAMLTQTLLSRQLGSYVKKMTKQRLVSFFSHAELGQTIAVLRDHKEVRFGNR